MNKKKLQIARNKIDQLDKAIFYLIKKRTAIVKYMLSLKGFKKQIVDHKRIKEILKKIKNKSIKNTNFNELYNNEQFLLSITTKGYGKRSSAYEYKIQSTNGKGIENIKTTKKNGKVIDSFVINEKDQIIMVSDKGQIIRVKVNQIRIMGRTTQGVSVFKIPETDKIVYVSRLEDIEFNK